MEAKIDPRKGTVDFVLPKLDPVIMALPKGIGTTPQQLRQAHREAFEMLLEDAGSSNEDCRKAAKEALGKIDPKGEIARAFQKR